MIRKKRVQDGKQLSLSVLLARSRVLVVFVSLSFFKSSLP